MDIDNQASIICKQIEKLEYQLNSGQALSAVQRKATQDKVDQFKANLKALEAQLAVVTKVQTKTLE